MSHRPSPSHEEASIARVLKLTSLFGGVQGLYALIAIVRNKITAVLLGRVGLGLIDNYNRTAEFIGASTNLGIAFSAVQHLARLHSAGRARAVAHFSTLVRSWSLIAAALGLLITLLFAPLAAAVMWNDWRGALSIAAVAPIVALTTLSGGELAILKGMGRVKPIAFISLFTAISTLLITTVSYFAWGIAGVLPALTLSSLAQWLLTLRFSHRAVPYRVQLRSWRFLCRGWRMVHLGLAYALSGFIAAGGEWLVRIIIMRGAPRAVEAAGAAVDAVATANAVATSASAAPLEAVGIYAAGFALTVSYSRLIFTAMDADYFPRLSAATQHRDHQNIAVNRQIDVLVQLVTPSLLLFAAFLPWIVRLLYSPAFAVAATMTHWALPYLFFKAMAIPIAYLALAHARSRLYLAVESSYTLFFVTAMLLCYTLWGFVGAGAALSLADALYLVVVWVVYARKFDFSMASDTLRRCLLQSFLLLGGWFALSLPNLWWRYGLGALFFAISALLSAHFLLHSTGLLQRLSSRIRKNH